MVGLNKYLGVAPAAIVLVNNDLTPNVQNMLVRQLHIDEVIDGQTFDQRMLDPHYPNFVKINNQRVMVVRSFFETANRSAVDLALFVKAGLASAEINKFGPPGDTFQVVNIHWGQFGLF